MKVVWKYPLTKFDEGKQTLSIPVNAHFLHGEMQGSLPTMWFLVKKNSVVISRTFIIVGTGHESVPDDAKHMFTFTMYGYVYHVFEIAPSWRTPGANPVPVGTVERERHAIIEWSEQQIGDADLDEGA